MFGSGTMTLTILNKEMSGITKIVKSLEESGLLVKSVSETISEAKEQKGRFLGMVLGKLGASLLENLLTGNSTIIAGESTFNAGQGF